MKIKELLLGIIIAVVFFMFCVFGTKLIYDSPEFDRYCNYSEIYPAYPDKVNLTEAEINSQQQAYQKCSEEYDRANRNYSKNMFIISLVFGIIVATISAVFIEVISISEGLMLGSLMFIIYGTSRYWEYMDDLLRFLILTAALGLLMYVAYWMSKRTEKNNVNKKKRR